MINFTNPISQLNATDELITLDTPHISQTAQHPFYPHSMSTHMLAINTPSTSTACIFSTHQADILENSNSQPKLMYCDKTKQSHQASLMNFFQSTQQVLQHRTHNTTRDKQTTTTALDRKFRFLTTKNKDYNYCRHQQ